MYLMAASIEELNDWIGLRKRSGKFCADDNAERAMN
jgi:hypothetical protein